MPKPFKLSSVIVTLVLLLGACNLPSATDEDKTDSTNIVLTAAAQTVEANLTQAALQSPPTVVPTNTLAAPTATLSAPLASPTSPSAATPTQNCDKADFVTDVTIADGTNLNPNDTFTKTWRIKNTGTCSWTPSYAIIFSSGDAMSGPATQALVGNVNPGDTVDISVNLKAPATNGDYKGYWKLRNASSVTFATVYVDIKVTDSGGGKFAVTNATLSVSGSCGNFQITANITTNGAGTVTYKWKRSDGATDTVTHPDLVFDAAGTKSVTTNWATSASGDKWMDIYIDKPNHQQFGRASFSCP